MFALPVVLIASLQIAAAVGPHEAMTDASQDRRARALYQEVRCVVCQNESIADSEAGIAADLRADIRARIAGGENDDAIRSGLAARYGDYVLFRPRLTAANLILWVSPFLVLLAGAAALFGLVRRRRAEGAVPEAAGELTPEEAEALRRRLGQRLDDDSRNA